MRARFNGEVVLDNRRGKALHEKGCYPSYRPVDGAGARAPPVCEEHEPLGELARRAMARPAPWRWDPLLWCDVLGRLRGAVPLDRLIVRLSAAVEIDNDMRRAP